MLILAEELIRWAFDNYFNKGDIQKDLKSYFSDDDSNELVKRAAEWAAEGARTSTKKDFTQKQIDTIEKNWKDYLPDSVNDRIIDENKKLDIEGLDKLITSFSSEGQERAINRVNELAKTETINNLNKVSIRSSSIQEQINKELAGRISQFSRQDFLDIGIRDKSGLSKFADRLDVSESELQSNLEKEGFSIENGRIRK